MESLKRLRIPLRSSFTRIANQLEECLKLKQPDSDEIASMIAQLSNKWLKLDANDKEVLELLQNDSECTQEVFDIEFESVEAYSERYTYLKTKADRILSKLDFDSTTNTTINNDSNSKRRYKLPKIELRKFSGDIKEYLLFWGQFRKIHEDVEIDPEDKYQYLIQATVEGSRARDLVESFPPTADSYPQVIECMKARFGRDEMLIEVYVRELLSLVLSNCMSRNQTTSLLKLYDKVETHLRALETLGVTSDKYAAMLYPLVESCLPDDIIRIWERNFNLASSDKGENKTLNKLSALMNFLKMEVEGEERISLAKDGFGLESKRKNKTLMKQSVENSRDIPTAVGLFSGNEKNQSVKKNSCVFCEKSHESHDCRYAIKLTMDDKKKILARKGCCFLCMKNGHRIRDCKGRINCTKCQRRHYAIMCEQDDKVNDSSKKKTDVSRQERNITNDTALGNRTCSSEILLQTLYVRLRGKECQHNVRIIIDTGSQRSYISKRAAALMKYEALNEENVIHNLFGGVETPQKHFRYKIFMSSVQGNYHCNFEVLDQPKICADIPTPALDSMMKEISDRNIVLSEECIPINERTTEIAVLIGADVAGKLLTGKIEQLTNGVVGVETRLGWTLMGKVPVEAKTENNDLMALSLLTSDRKISDLWDLDTLGITDPAEKKTRKEMEDASKEHFLCSLKREKSGRYEVSLPWISGHPPLPDNRIMAERRLGSTVKTLQCNKLLESYEEVFNEWLEEGIIEYVAPEEEDNTDCHYLPHRAIIKMDSTTKIRPVFDASAKTKNSVSLNDCLEKGPNYIELIPSILNRFRFNAIGVISDIRKAFLQICLNKKDRDYLRFLWWESGNPENLRIFRHQRVVFGVSSSPFLLGATLNYHLENVPSRLKKTADKLRDSMYVDNCVASVENEEELKTFIEQSKEIMMSGMFDLRGWKYNVPSPKFADVTDEMLIPTSNENTYYEAEETVSALGIKWNLDQDTLSCDVKELIECQDKPVTKRLILSQAHKLFDPIGFTTPVSLIPKLLLQECWRQNFSWDAELPNDLAKKFRRWQKELVHLKSIKIPRRLMTSLEPNTQLTLHILCDASQSAYATCIFLRTESSVEVSCRLIQAKARVSPLKPISISRLELLACCIGARLKDSVIKDLHLKNVPTYFWSDSMNALCWIKNEEIWTTFVMNRVKEIRSLSCPDEWRHLPGNLNAADLPSRGCFPETLIQKRWWEGPEWLRKPQAEWPTSNSSPQVEVVNSEKKKTIISTNANLETAKYYDRFSSYMRILRVTAWIYRFYRNCKSSNSTRSQGDLNVNEIKNAELVLLKIIQQEAFPKGINDKIRALQPVIDEKGILRVKTRIMMRKDKKNFRFPIILPSNHPVVNKLIAWKHRELKHAGIQILMNDLREKFWILKCRKTVRQAIFQCVRCRRFTVTPSEVEPIPLPEDRVREASVFEIAGVDLAGPLILKGGQKAWIVLFTCAIYRAVHLELVTSLSTEAFLQSLRRFIARRGRPSIMYSDNGSNFGGASNSLKEVDLEKIQSQVTLQNITWKFIPPAAPWWGGWWERLIGIMKQILRRVLGQASLQYEELYTVLCDTESLINSRPITYLSADVEDLVPLTPSMFLQEIKETGVPDIDQIEITNLRKRYLHIQKVRLDLRKRFRSEYLGHLRQTSKLPKSPKPVSIGDIVLIGSDNLKRIQWPLARVIKLFPGKDGICRVAELKTQFGTQIRAIQKLYQLEVSENEGDILRSKIAPSTVRCNQINAEENLESPLAVPMERKTIGESPIAVPIHKTIISESPVIVPMKKKPIEDSTDQLPVLSRTGRVVKPVKRLDL